MDIGELFTALLQDNTTLLWIVGLGLPVAGLWLIVSHLRRAKQDVLRRVAADPGAFATTTLSSKARVANRIKRSIESAASAGGLDETAEKQMKALRAKLVQIGYFDKSSVALYFGLRVVTATVFAFGAFLGFALFAGLEPWTRVAMGVLVAFAIGYILPSMALESRIKKAVGEHQSGFPDFMDLLVVCVEAGLSMESGLQRIAFEMRQSYPSLAMHLEIATVEIRSGKGLSAAMESFARRLGIEEASSFATLLTQSEELGSSLSQSLRVYSEDMRNKRLMKAEEKAHALPAKLVVPLTLFVFPTLLVVLLLPVVISVSSIL